LKIKRTKLDKDFSRFIRARDKWTCQRCGKYKARVKDNGEIVAPGLDCAHFKGRRKVSTRFDPDNCDALCSPGCHQYFHEHQAEYKQWKRLRLGGVEFAMLEARARKHVKLDKQAIKIWLDYEMKKLSEAA